MLIKRTEEREDTPRDFLTLEDLDPVVSNALTGLKEALVERFASLTRAFAFAEPDSEGHITTSAFTKMCQEACFNSDHKRLLGYLDPERSGKVDLNLLDEDAVKGVKKFVRHGGTRCPFWIDPPQVPTFDGSKLSGLHTLDALKTKLRKMHGSLLKAWRVVLDKDGNGTIDFETFQKKGEKILGPFGSFEGAWDALGMTKPKDKLTLEVFEPVLAEEKARLCEKLLERYGSLVAAFEHLGGTDHDLRITPKGFKILCAQVLYDGNIPRLFEYLDPKGEGVVDLGDLDPEAVEAYHTKIEAREKTQKAKQEPAPSVDTLKVTTPAEAFVGMLAQRYGTAARAWRIALDPKGLGPLTPSEFAIGCAAVGYGGSRTLLWKSLGMDEDARFITMRDLDRASFKLLVAFRRCMVKKWESLEGAFAGLLEPLGPEEFQKLCKKAKCGRLARKVFPILACPGGDGVTWEKVRFLEDQWRWVNKKPPVPRRAGQATPPPETPPSDEWGRLGVIPKPRCVAGPPKGKLSASLPDLRGIGLRNAWNYRHHILDYNCDKEAQHIFEMTEVMIVMQTEVKERVRERMEQQPVDVFLNRTKPRGWPLCPPIAKLGTKWGSSQSRLGSTPP